MQNNTLATKKKRERIFIILMLLIPVVQHLVFFLYPNLEAFTLAFRRENPDHSTYWTLKNFTYIFENLSSGSSRYLTGVKNALIYWFFQNVFMFSLSYVWTYFFYKKLKGRSVYRIVFYVTSIVGLSTTCAIFKYMLNDGGLIGILYKKVTGSATTPMFLAQEEYVMKTVLAFIFWNGFGGSYIIFGGAFSKIPTEVLEAGMLDGVQNMWQEIGHIIFPLTWPTFSTLFLINLSQILVSTGPILLLTENISSTYSLSFIIFKDVAISHSYYEPSALGLLMTAVTLPIFFLSRMLMRKKEAVEY